MAKKAKQSKKGGGKKPASKKKSPAGSDAGLRPSIMFAAILFASVCLVFAFEALLGAGSTLRYAASLASGMLAGFSGNPLWYSLPARIAAYYGAPPSVVACFPSGLLHRYFTPELSILFFTFVMAAVAAYDGIKKQRIRYEPAVLIPATALPVMYLSMQMRETSASFYELFRGVFAGPYPTGFIAAATIILGISKWAMRSDGSGGRHWAWSLAAGPVIGFWFGYLEFSWTVSLVALLYFSYLFFMNEDITGIIHGLPFAAMPLIVGKIVFSKSGAGAAFSVAAGPVPWLPIVMVTAGFAGAHLFSTRLMAALPAGARRAAFFISLFVFLTSILLLNK
ncbi:MAG: hypothetical protein WCX65_00405 [bacterium]